MRQFFLIICTVLLLASSGHAITVSGGIVKMEPRPAPISEGIHQLPLAPRVYCEFYPQNYCELYSTLSLRMSQCMSYSESCTNVNQPVEAIIQACNAFLSCSPDLQLLVDLGGLAALATRCQQQTADGCNSVIEY